MMVKAVILPLAVMGVVEILCKYNKKNGCFMRALHALQQPGLHCLIFLIRYKSELIKCVYLCTFLIAA